MKNTNTVAPTTNQKVTIDHLINKGEQPGVFWLQLLEQSYSKESPKKLLEDIEQLEFSDSFFHFSNAICPYSKVHFVVYGIEQVYFLLSQKMIDVCQTKLVHNTEKCVTSFSGKCNNTSFKGTVTKTGWETNFVHQFHTKSIGATFLYKSFLRELDHLNTWFGISLSDAYITKLQGDVRIILPQIIEESISDITKSVITVLESPNQCYKYPHEISPIFITSTNGRTVRISGDRCQKRGEKLKGLKFDLTYDNFQQLSTECNIRSLGDLVHLRSLISFNHQLIQVFNTIHIQNTTVSYQANDEVLMDLNSHYNWDKLKTYNYSLYHQKKRRHEDLVKYTAKYSIKELMMKAIKDKLT